MSMLLLLPSSLDLRGALLYANNNNNNANNNNNNNDDNNDNRNNNNNKCNNNYNGNRNINIVNAIGAPELEVTAARTRGHRSENSRYIKLPQNSSNYL